MPKIEIGNQKYEAQDIVTAALFIKKINELGKLNDADSHANKTKLLLYVEQPEGSPALVPLVNKLFAPMTVPNVTEGARTLIRQYNDPTKYKVEPGKPQTIADQILSYAERIQKEQNKEREPNPYMPSQPSTTRSNISGTPTSSKPNSTTSSPTTSPTTRPRPGGSKDGS